MRAGSSLGFTDHRGRGSKGRTDHAQQGSEFRTGTNTAGWEEEGIVTLPASPPLTPGGSGHLVLPEEGEVEIPTWLFLIRATVSVYLARAEWSLFGSSLSHEAVPFRPSAREDGLFLGLLSAPSISGLPASPHPFSIHEAIRKPKVSAIMLFVS